MYDIIFISDTFDRHLTQWYTLKSRFPLVKHADSVESAKVKSLTKMFWVVWPDIEISADFFFDYEVPEWDQKYTHVFKNGNDFDGVCLFPKDVNISSREVTYRFFTNRKEVDINASVPLMFDTFIIDSYEEYETALHNTTTEMFWGVSRNIKIADNFKFDLYFDSRTDEFIFDRTHNHVFKNETPNGKITYDRVFLFAKSKPVSKREIENKHLVNRKEWDVITSTDKLYDQFVVDTYDEYLYALEHSTTEMFWTTSRNIKVVDDFKFDLYFDSRTDEFEYDRTHNHVFVHLVDNKKLYNGVFLFSKASPVSKREIDNRHIVDRKEWDVIASGPVMYDRFVIHTYDDYKSAIKLSTTEMVWIIPKEIEIIDNSIFNLYFDHSNVYDRNQTHVFKHKFRDEITSNGIFLVSKFNELSHREITYRNIIEKKSYDTVASKLKPYDIVFVSYNEPNADENFADLKIKYPNAKRVHGVKGIHQAHIKAAEIVETELFWVVDADAKIVDEFKFDYQAPIWDQEVVHVWRSKNPVNGLEYGYGGVKLLPRTLTLNMDLTKPDMTTSISTKFKAISQISNITAFNTDPFSAWKSAFRECAKLASKVIDRQKSDETLERLNIWVSQGADKPFGEYAIRGAIAGRAFVESFPNEIYKINDFEWLKQKFLENEKD